MRGRLADGIWLEHSTSYQFLGIEALERMIAAYGDDPELEGLLSEMRRRPAFRRARLRDRPLRRLRTRSAARLGAGREHRDRVLRGLRRRLCVRPAPGPEGDSATWRSPTASTTPTHKHADELSFELFDEGLPIGHRHGPLRQGSGAGTRLRRLQPRPQHARRRWSRPPGRRLEPRLRLRADRDGGGRRLVRDRGPQPAAEEVQSVKDERLLLYRPGEMLVIVDRVESEPAHTYTRYLHLGPDIEVRKSGSSTSRSGRSAATVATPRPRLPSAAPRCAGRRSRCRASPRPRSAASCRATTLAFAATGQNDTFVTTIALDAAALRAEEVDAAGPRTTVSLAGCGRGRAEGRGFARRHPVVGGGRQGLRRACLTPGRMGSSCGHYCETTSATSWDLSRWTPCSES